MSAFLTPFSGYRIYYHYPVGFRLKTLDFMRFFRPSLIIITIPDTVENIGYHALSVSSGKLNIKVSDDNQYFCDIDGVLFDKNKTTIFTYAKDVVQSDYTVPDSVNYIGNGTFSGCRNLTNIIIPDSVKSIGNSAFYLCDALTDIKIPNSVTYISCC